MTQAVKLDLIAEHVEGASDEAAGSIRVAARSPPGELVEPPAKTWQRRQIALRHPLERACDRAQPMHAGTALAGTLVGDGATRFLRIARFAQRGRLPGLGLRAEAVHPHRRTAARVLGSGRAEPHRWRKRRLGPLFSR